MSAKNRAERRPLPRIAFVLLAIIVGAVLGNGLAADMAAEVPILGFSAWTLTKNEARSALGAIFGIQITLVTIIVSITTLHYQSIASQYSPRLVALLEGASSLQRTVLIFLLSAAYTFAAVRKLGLSATPEAVPRPVIVGSVALLALSLWVVVANLLSVFRSLQVEVVLNKGANVALAAAERQAHERQRFAQGEVAPHRMPSHALPIVAKQSGYVVAFDFELLQQLAQQDDVQIRIERQIGQYVVLGEQLGWMVSAADASTVLTSTIAKAVVVDVRRLPYHDVGLGLRVLSDVADRALSPGVNAPSTARQVLQQMRAVLRRVAAMPLGDLCVVDDDGMWRLSISYPTLKDYLWVAVDGPSRYGAGDPDVVLEILRLALEVGRAARDADGRKAACALAHQALADAISRGQMDEQRLTVLRHYDATVQQTLSD